jgi:CDP-2,3-bis-(O-geranylgeranyl)-sn-glycerol synthase
VIELKLLLLIIIANGAPVLARNILKSRFETAVDFNRVFFDGRPVFGPTKTWRGIISAIFLTIPFALLLGFTAELGLVLAALAMAGDLLGSFIKRRFKLAPSSRALGLDQVPESLLPMLACQVLLGLGWQSTVMVVFLFFVMELLLSRLLYQLHIRKHPY